jgi:hypothetical protein
MSLASFLKRRARPHDWLAHETGRSLPQWLRYVEDRIAAHTTPPDDPNHGHTDSSWIADLVLEIKRLGTIGKRPFDENMRISRITGLILCAWYAHVHRAKVMDPRRPIALRREAYERRQSWLAELALALHDERHDPELWPDQEWESPFLPNARNGDFV